VGGGDAGGGGVAHTRVLHSISSVIPGIFVSLALRYDYASHVARTLKKNPDAVPSKDQTYSKPYFITVMTAYVAGLLATMAVMHTFQKAQPALLYLSPACSECAIRGGPAPRQPG
jgi:minor histocompatibility antigen H13